MTVAELIKRLNDMPEEARVWVDGNLSGYIGNISPVQDVRLEAGNPGVVVIDC